MRILVDMDGVVADWAAGMQLALQSPDFLDWSRWEILAEDATDEHRAAFARALRSPRFYRRLTPIEGAVDALRAMSEQHDVFLCSTPDLTNQTCASDKIHWTRAVLGHAWTTRLILTHDKTIVHGDVLIDDKPQVTGAMVPTWEHILFDQPYNRNVLNRRRITQWSEWAEMLS
jgi:5'-nucleotidase